MSQGRYDTAQICLMGHIITDSSTDCPQDKMNFCDKCGASTIVACQKCNTPIRGMYRGNYGIGLDSAPSFCHACGKPYPWTEAKIKAAQDLSDELEKLSPNDKDTLKKSIEDIIRDTPQSQVAAIRFKKLVLKAGSEAATAFRQILVDIASEAVKKQIWG